MFIKITWFIFNYPIESQTLPEKGNHIKSQEEVAGLYLRSADV
jgi:hypothetical protein